MVLSREQRLSFQHLREDATRTPDIHLHIVLLPGEHNLGSPVVSCRHVAGHLRVLDASQAEITDLQIAVFINEDVAGLQVPVDHTGGMDIFQSTLRTVSGVAGGRIAWIFTYENLIEEVLDELLLERSRSQQAVEIGTQELSHEVAGAVSVVSHPFDQRDIHVLEWGNENIAQADDLWRRSVNRRYSAQIAGKTHVLMSEVLEQLQLSVGTLG